MRINVRKWVGENAMAQEDGKAVYDLIHDPLRQGETVELDFEGVDVFASPFFNASVGRLLEDLERDALNARLRFEHLSTFGKRVLRRVIENAEYYIDYPGRGFTGQTERQRSPDATHEYKR